MTKRQRKDDSPEPPAARKPAALEWMRTAQLVQGGECELADLSPPLDARLQAALREAGMERLFPVQAAVWTALAGGTATGHDLCVHCRWWPACRAAC
jgi:superfamily II DNA/RNA helicase